MENLKTLGRVSMATGNDSKVVSQLILGFLGPVVVALVVGMAASHLTAERMLTRLEVQMLNNGKQISEIKDAIVELARDLRNTDIALHEHEKAGGHAVMEQRMHHMEAFIARLEGLQ